MIHGEVKVEEENIKLTIHMVMNLIFI